MKIKGHWILFGLVLLKLLISIPFINSNPIDLDEPFSIFHSQNSLSGLFQIFQNENNPPLHFVLLHFWEQLFGIGPVSVRSLSLLFSVLTIVVLFKTGIKFFNSKTAIIVCLLFIFSDYHQYYGLEARTYSLLVLEFSVIIYLLLSIILAKNKVSFQTAVMLGLINILVFYTHYISIFILISEAFILLIYFKNFQLKNLLISGLIFIVGILPWISVLSNRVNTVKSNGTWLSKAQFSELYGLINKFFNDKWSFLTLVIVVIMLLIAKRSIFFKNISENRSVYLGMFVIFIIPFLGTFILSKFGIVEIFYDRYLFFLTLPLFLIVSILFGDREKIYTYGLIFIGLAYIMRFDIKPNNDRNGNELAEYVKTLNKESIVIAPFYYDLTFLYHYDRQLFKNNLVREISSQKGLYGINELKNLEQINLKNKVIVIDAGFEFVNPGQSVKNWFLDHEYILESEKGFKGNYKVYVMNKKTIGQ